MMKFYSLCICLLLPSLINAQSDIIPEARWTMLDQYLSRQQGFSGYVICGQQGKVMYSRGFGFADRKNLVPFSDQSLYTIGSITKSFTATAILKLYEQKKLQLTDSISKYFNGVPNDKQSITLHHLLTHSAGLPGAIGDDYDILSASAFQQKVWEQPLLFSPGSGYEYSNVGYSLLGMIVEIVSGQNYSTYLQENIFSPARMTTAGYENPGADYSNEVHGYFPDGADWGIFREKPRDGNEPSWHLKANGGLLMSANDMFQWYMALRDNLVLSPATLQLQTSPHVYEGQQSYYGYGYAVDKEGNCVQHNGGNRIFKADFRWFPKEDWFFFSATNDANVRLFRLNDEIIQILETGTMPEETTWDEISLDSFPIDQDQYTAQAFLDMILHYSEERAAIFIPEYCTKGIVERNGETRLKEIFARLHADVSPDGLKGVFRSENKVMLVAPVNNEPVNVKITLTLDEHKLDRLSAEIE